MMNMPKLFFVGVCAAILGGGNLSAGEAVDLSKIERRVLKEPAYKCSRPFYGLYVFGPDAKTRVWAVLDKSRGSAASYDILFFDRNADGDLTAPDERIQGRAGTGSVVFSIGSFVDPVTKQTHTEISITRREDGSVMLRMKWCDKIVVAGGYAPESGPYTQFAAAPAEAPILWPSAEGPFSFQFWMPKPLTIGAADDVRVFLGQRGHGPNTFCAVPDNFLAKDIPVLATLIYSGKDGVENRIRSELRDRC
jgi:hypothetical protein